MKSDISAQATTSTGPAAAPAVVAGSQRNLCAGLRWRYAGNRAAGPLPKYRKFKRPLPSYSGTQASAIEHVQESIEASWRTDAASRRSGLGSKGPDLDRLVYQS